MEYDDPYERELIERLSRWDFERDWREICEEEMDPDERLDEVRWDIFRAAIARGMHHEDAARLAMDGTYRQRKRVRREVYRGLVEESRRRWEELHPGAFERA
jgi:hypothetical protein